MTFFFNGGQEEAFPMEDRVLVPSPKVATYDLLPGMSCLEVASQVIASLKKGIPSNLPTEQDSGMNPYSLVICNLAPPDMVGHTGHYEATKEAVKVTDTAIAQIWKVCQSLGVYLVVTSDHGNAEKMVDPATGNIHTAHTTNPVPLIIASPKGKCIIELESGLNMSEQSLPALCDVAPTVLELMGLSIPLEMSGRSLVLKDQKQSMQ